MRRERESNAGHGSNNSSNNSSNNKLASWPVRRPEPILRAPPSYTSQLPPYSAEDPVNQINEINPAEPQQPLEPLEPPKKAATK
ncbi:unnamed protein product [Kuraishia capsulata CBS 1993]|uniref:Uncharacterized protein n=1 Tax=Kuraishia capsulata CBS 1993 TaxID=1382522 RepID=W6ML21_9ASCO|nr:uncharacterized protein KUCA_T00002757001 [Kuraishia capsulata CBS 1993]CDK26783.1 unnamed protein product [Kuraishia capsulata CBS 1993]